MRAGGYGDGPWSFVVGAGPGNGYNDRTMRIQWIVFCLLAAGLLTSSAPARARQIARLEGWASGGYLNPDYDPSPLAVGRAGLGARFLEQFSVGGSVQVDRDHWFGLGYVGVTLPDLFLIETFGRFYVGRRDDVSDLATGWSAGVATGTSSVKLFADVHGIIQPGHAFGVSIGFSF